MYCVGIFHKILMAIALLLFENQIVEFLAFFIKVRGSYTCCLLENNICEHCDAFHRSQRVYCHLNQKIKFLNSLVFFMMLQRLFSCFYLNIEFLSPLRPSGHDQEPREATGFRLKGRNSNRKFIDFLADFNLHTHLAYKQRLWFCSI